MSADLIALKPCPHCNGEAELGVTQCVGGPLCTAYCPKCAVIYKSEAEAIAAWNTRAADALEARPPAIEGRGVAGTRADVEREVDQADVAWQSIASVPRDGRKIEARHIDGSTLVMYANLEWVEGGEAQRHFNAWRPVQEKDGLRDELGQDKLSAQHCESGRCGGERAVSGPAKLGAALLSGPDEVSRLNLALGDWINKTTLQTARANLAEARAASLLEENARLRAALSGGVAGTREAVARIVDPGSWSFRGLWPDGLGEGPHRTTRIAAAEAKALVENDARKALSLERADLILSALAQQPVRGVGEAPWDDCKVAFGFDNPEVFEAWMEETDDGRGLLPEGWTLCECDGSGARYVVVFRVEGPLRAEDGLAVQAILAAIAGAEQLQPGAGS